MGPNTCSSTRLNIITGGIGTSNLMGEMYQEQGQFERNGHNKGGVGVGTGVRSPTY